MLVSLGNVRVCVNADADVYSHRSFLRHLVPVPTSDADDHLLDNHLAHLVGGSLRHFTLWHLRGCDDRG